MPATNRAGNLHNALGYVDTAVNLRKAEVGHLRRDPGRLAH